MFKQNINYLNGIRDVEKCMNFIKLLFGKKVFTWEKYCLSYILTLRTMSNWISSKHEKDKRLLVSVYKRKRFMIEFCYSKELKIKLQFKFKFIFWSIQSFNTNTPNRTSWNEEQIEISIRKVNLQIKNI